ncbi:MAG: hypothetical protein KAG53_00590 [Endozoicomonadaceae bacterium]|nr:hypothetical protein [Endozoicomonadaceae bacterium]
MNTLVEPLPIYLISIQVDGDSEFRNEVEHTCETLKLLLSRKPKWNGTVEQDNGATAVINQAFGAYHQYHDQSHCGIGLTTPMSYYQQFVQFA